MFELVQNYVADSWRKPKIKRKLHENNKININFV